MATKKKAVSSAPKPTAAAKEKVVETLQPTVDTYKKIIRRNWLPVVLAIVALLIFFTVLAVTNQRGDRDTPELLPATHQDEHSTHDGYEEPAAE